MCDLLESPRQYTRDELDVPLHPSRIDGYVLETHGQLLTLVRVLGGQGNDRLPFLRRDAPALAALLLAHSPSPAEHGLLPSKETEG